MPIDPRSHFIHVKAGGLNVFRPERDVAGWKLDELEMPDLGESGGDGFSGHLLDRR